MSETADFDFELFKSAIRSRLVSLGISAREASRRAGFNPGYVGDILEGRSKKPEIDRIMRLANGLDMTLAGVSLPSDSQQPMPSVATQGELLPLLAPKIAPNERFSALPDSVSAYVPALPGRTATGAMRVFSDANAPRFFMGETVYVSDEAPQAGDFVIITFADRRITIARLAEQTPDRIAFGWLDADKGETAAATEVTVQKIVASVT